MAKLYIKNTDGTYSPYQSVVVSNLDIVQETGSSLTSAMSQKAVTDELATKQDTIIDIETIRSNAQNASDVVTNMTNAGYLFAGIATIDTNPGIPDAKVFYIANGKGTYTNFGGLEVTEDEVVVLYYDTEWHKVSTGIASQAKLSELDNKAGNKVDILAGTNLINPDKCTEGYGIVASSGTIIGNQPSLKITDYIAVNGKDVISNGIFNTYWGGAVYNENKELLRSLSTKQYTYQSGDAYIRITFRVSDTKPIANYGNILISYQPFNPVGGYVADLYNRTTSLKNITMYPSWIADSYILVVNGYMIANAPGYAATDYIPVSEGQVIKTNVVLNGNYGIAFYDGSKAKIDSIAGNDNRYKDGEFTVPVSAVWMRMTNRVTTLPLSDVYVRVYGLADIDNSIKTLNENVDYVNKDVVETNILLCADGFSIGFINYNTGNIDSDDNYRLSDYVPCSPNKKFKTNCRFLGNAGVYFFDKNKKKISGATYTEIVTENGIIKYCVFETPNTDGIAYMRLSHAINYSYVSVDALWVRSVGSTEDVAHTASLQSDVAYNMMRDVIVRQYESNPYKRVPTDKSYIAFHLDDGEYTNSEMVELFHTKDVPLCLAIPALRLSTICANNKTILENCLDVEADGGEVMTHSLTEMSSTSTEADIRAFFEYNKSALVAAGLHPYGVVCAGGGDQNPNKEWVKRYLYSTHQYGIFFQYLSDPNVNYIRHGFFSDLESQKSFIDANIATHTSWIFNGHAPYDVDPSYVVCSSVPKVANGDKYSVNGVDNLVLTVYKVVGNIIYFNQSNYNIIVPTGPGSLTKISGTGDSTLSYSSFYNQQWIQKVEAIIDYIRSNYTEGTDFEFVNTSAWMRKCVKSAAQLYMESLE